VEEERLEAWLFRVTRNLCYDRLRQVRAARERGTGSLDEPAAQHLADDAPDPEDHAQGVDTRRQIEAALRGLDEPYRSTVVLREIQGLSYQEISEILGTPMNTVKVHLHRGRRKLREALKEARVYEAAG
jgi:RNA polymerase sigma-70 factor (ECF subfamily)